jgi:DNA polymerase III delta prime subunit
MDQFITFQSAQELKVALGKQQYIASDEIATIMYLSQELGKPLLTEGPAGVGKTELAKAIAGATGRELIRLQCYEGLDETKALLSGNTPNNCYIPSSYGISFKKRLAVLPACQRLQTDWRMRRMYSSQCVSCYNAPSLKRS